MSEYFFLIIGAMLVNNFVLSQFLGICPFLGVSKKLGSAVGMSLAVLFAASAFSHRPLRRDMESPEGAAEVDALVQEALTVYFYGVSMGLLNAALRLMRITHYDVQAILYRLSEQYPELCFRTRETPLSRMTGYAPMTEILAAVHSLGRVRLFMS